jgi:hypothetical protein
MEPNASARNEAKYESGSWMWKRCPRSPRVNLCRKRQASQCYIVIPSVSISAPLIPMSTDPEYDLQPSQSKGIERDRDMEKVGKQTTERNRFED